VIALPPNIEERLGGKVRHAHTVAYRVYSRRATRWIGGGPLLP